MTGYLRYLGERLVIFVATVFISVTVVFFVPRLVPGDPLSAIMGKLSKVGVSLGSRALVDEYAHRFGLDKSLWDQYLAYLGQVAHGDLGYSIGSFPTTVQ